MKKLKFTPWTKCIIITTEEAETEQHGFIISKSTKTNDSVGRIVAVPKDWGNDMVGDLVIFRKFKFEAVNIDNKTYYAGDIKDVLSKVEVKNE